MSLVEEHEQPNRNRRRKVNIGGPQMVAVDYDLILKHSARLTYKERTILFATSVFPTYKAIAENLHISVGAVTQRLHRARQGLRVAIEAEERRGSVR